MSSAGATMVVSVAFVAALAGLAAWIAWLAARLEQARERSRLDARLELVRRVTGEEALRAFLESEEGRRFLDDDPTERIRAGALRSIGRGILALFLGAGLCAAGIYTSVRVAGVAGFLLILGGLGLLVAAAVTRRLSLRWRPEGDR